MYPALFVVITCFIKQPHTICLNKLEHNLIRIIVEVYLCRVNVIDSLALIAGYGRHPIANKLASKLSKFCTNSVGKFAKMLLCRWLFSYKYFHVDQTCSV